MRFVARRHAACLALLVAAVAAPVYAQSSLSMVGIKPNQVFQRNGNLPSSPGTVYLQPTSAIPATYSRYTISLLTPAGAVERTLVPATAYQPGKLLEFSLATGKTQRRVRVSFFEGSTERLRWDSPAFSVGDVFLVAGQSNAASHGTLDGAPAVADINSFHMMANPLTKAWSPLKETMEFATAWDLARSGTPWIAFADELGARTQVPVAIINVARGGTAVRFWLPGSTASDPITGQQMNLFEGRLRPAGAALANYLGNGSVYCSFRAVLWHQGEGDALSNPVEDRDYANLRNNYARDLQKVAEEFKRRTGCGQPWMVARASYTNEHWYAKPEYVQYKWAGEQAIRRAQNYLPTRGAVPGQVTFLQGPDTDLMAGYMRDGQHKYRPDGLHFRRKSLTLHGKMWADQVARAMGFSSPLPATETMVPEAKAVWDLFSTVLRRTPDEILSDSGFTYWVQYLALQNLQTDADIVAHANAVIKPLMQDSHEYRLRNWFPQVVNRAPTASEVAYYVKRLSLGAAESSLRAQAAAEVGLTPAQKQIWLLHVYALNRVAAEIDIQAPEFVALVAAYQGGKPSITIANELASSDEYKIRAAFLKAVLRQPSATEIATYRQKLAADPSLRSNATKLADLVWAQPGA
ncbi:sialate O-acetylesterase [Pseudoduganella sp. OTU4001]|uniref:sialate O-acetylesterase n=1 Tax=Pseudoduganella sp. OTU4001 TaxID=3043854 RepID=UPI00313AFCD2